MSNSVLKRRCSCRMFVNFRFNSLLNVTFLSLSPVLWRYGGGGDSFKCLFKRKVGKYFRLRKNNPVLGKYLIILNFYFLGVGILNCSSKERICILRWVLCVLLNEVKVDGISYYNALHREYFLCSSCYCLKFSADFNLIFCQFYLQNI